MKHAYDLGLVTFNDLAVKNKLKKCRKLVEKDIHEILALRLEKKLEYREIAEIKGVAFGTIGKICRGERYKKEVSNYVE